MKNSFITSGPDLVKKLVPIVLRWWINAFVMYDQYPIQREREREGEREENYIVMKKKNKKITKN